MTGLSDFLERVKASVADKRKEIFEFSPDTERGYHGTRDELQVDLSTDDEARAAEVLADAEAAHGRLQDRVESAERRATTLQGSSAVAASLALASAGLLVDPSKIDGTLSRSLFAAAVVWIIFCLVMCTWRATQATSRVHPWTVPGDLEALSRPAQTVAEARIERSASLLWAVSENQRFARYKIALLGAAADWVRRAVFGLLVLAILTAIYSLAHHSANRPATPPMKTASLQFLTGDAHAIKSGTEVQVRASRS
jgi:hypothetical protein